MTANSQISIRPAASSDVPLVLALVKELAEYEHLAHTVVATEDGLRQALFGPHPSAETIIAEIDLQPAGYALFFTTFSTFLGRSGIWLEDLFVRPAFRGRGAGKALLLEVIAIARRRNCGRVEWNVLGWNAPAIRFYESLGAKAMDEWRMFRLTEDAIARLADQSH